MRKKTRQSPSVILWSKREQVRHSDAVEQLVALVQVLKGDIARLQGTILGLSEEIDRLKSLPLRRERKPSPTKRTIHNRSDEVDLTGVLQTVNDPESGFDLGAPDRPPSTRSNDDE